MTWARLSRRTLVKASLAGAAVAFPGEIRPAIAIQSTPTAGAKVPLGEAVADLSPRAIWQNFNELTQIPRPSHHEAEVSAYLAAFGLGLGLETDVDEVGNVLIRKPAPEGMEDCKVVVLQAHMDMVGVAAEGSDHVFESDPMHGSKVTG